MGRVWAYLAPIAALAVAAPAAAATTVWTSDGPGVSVSNNAINLSMSGGVKVQITAWTSTNSSNHFSGTNGHQRATLGLWDYGMGAQKGSNDYHTVDNTDGIDYLLLQFNTEVALETVVFTSGWYGYDSDATISYADVNPASYGGNYKTLSNSFWNAASGQLNANKMNSDTPNNNFTPNTVNWSVRNVNKPVPVTSDVWLIAARIGSNNSYKDAFKVAGFIYSMPHDGAVPEPSTWAMLIIGMGAIGAAMRRQARARLVLT